MILARFRQTRPGETEGTSMDLRNVAKILVLLSLAAPPVRAATLDEEAGAFLNVVAVAGREQPAADFIAGRLAGLPAHPGRARQRRAHRGLRRAAAARPAF
jgi:hypothetical protein